MIFRRFVLTLLILGGFWYIVSHYNGGGPIRERTLAGKGSPLTLTEAHAAPEYDSEEMNNISVYKKALPSVVNITSSTQTLNFFYGLVPSQGQGSGFILDKQGHILTNYHVVADAQQIEVTTSDKRRIRARVIGRDQGRGPPAAIAHIVANCSPSSDAPPTSAPSTSSCATMSAMFLAFTEPP